MFSNELKKSEKSITAAALVPKLIAAKKPDLRAFG